MKLHVLFPFFFLSITFQLVVQSQSNDQAVKFERYDNLCGLEFVHDFAIHPTHPDTLLMGTNLGLYISKNGGQNWEYTFMMPWNDHIITVMFDPLLIDVFYVNTSNGLLKSGDAGETWEMVFENPEYWQKNMSMPPNQSDTLYFAGSNINVSYDAGQTWEVMEEDYNRLYVSRANSKVMVKSRNFMPVDSMFVSSDRGETWTRIADSLRKINYDEFDQPIDTFYIHEFTLQEIVFDHADENIFYIVSNDGIFKTTNKGLDFEALNFWFDYGNLVVHPTDSEILYSASEGGFYKSADKGESWMKLINLWAEGNAMTHPQFISISGDAETLWGEFNGRLFKKSGSGSWEQQGLQGLYNFRVNSIIPSITLDTLVIGNFRANFSTDGGVTWSATPYHYNAAPAVIQKILQVPGTWDQFYVAGNGNYLYKTNDQGATFHEYSVADTNLHYFKLSSFIIDRNNPDTLYSSCIGLGVYKTADGGLTWSEKNNGLDTNSIQSLLIDPENSNILYAAAVGTGIFKSTDGAETWAFHGNGIGDINVNSLYLNPLNPNHLIAAHKNGTDSLYVTFNGGDSWTALQLRDMGYYHICFDPQDELNVYLSWNERGIYESNDGGLTWHLWVEEQLEFGPFEYLRKVPGGILSSSSHGGFMFIRKFNLDTVQFTPTVKCAGDSTATIEIKTAAYYPGAKYSIDGGNITSNDSLFTGIPAGNYYPVVIIDDDTITKGEITIETEQLLFVNLEEEITAYTEGETPIEGPEGFSTYSWSTGSNTRIETLTGMELSSDDFYLTLTCTDNLSCTSRDSILVITVDNTMPEIICSENQEVTADDNNVYTIIGDEFDYTAATDNWDIMSVTNNFNDAESLAGVELPLGLNRIIWTALDAAGNEQSCSFEVEVNAFVDVEPEEYATVHLHPNPVQQTLHIDFGKIVPQEVILTGIDGKIIQKTVLTDKTCRLEMGAIPRGVYILNISTAYDMQQYKIIKK